jgi:adenylate cyclase
VPLDSGFDELDELCTAAGDPVSLVVGMAGQLTTLIFERRFAEAVRMADRCSELLESIGDANLTLGLSIVVANARLQFGQPAEASRLA